MIMADRIVFEMSDDVCLWYREAASAEEALRDECFERDWEMRGLRRYKKHGNATCKTRTKMMTLSDGRDLMIDLPLKAWPVRDQTWAHQRLARQETR